MFGRKYNLVIGLTVFRPELLRISIPALGKLQANALLVICNVSGEILTRRAIRRMGYRGAVKIISAPECLNVIQARSAIINSVFESRNVPDWIVFVNAGDALVGGDVPNLDDGVYAVMQNALCVRYNVSDLFMAIDSPRSELADGENIALLCPHRALSGNFVRTAVMRDFLSVMNNLDIDAPDPNVSDCIMWECLNLYVKNCRVDMTPIYMDRINYVLCAIGSAAMRCGTVAALRAYNTRNEKLINNARTALAAALAAPSEQQ